MQSVSEGGVQGGCKGGVQGEEGGVQGGCEGGVQGVRREVCREGEVRPMYSSYGYWQ